MTTQHKINPKFEQRQIQGTGGFSYNQKGRLRNTPNGIQYGTVVPGRIIDNKEAAIAGFVSSVTDRSIALQTNYAKIIQVNIIDNLLFLSRLAKLNCLKMVLLDCLLKVSRVVNGWKLMIDLLLQELTLLVLQKEIKLMVKVWKVY